MSGLIFTAIYYILVISQYAIFVRVVVSWLPIAKDNKFIRILYQITEPILAPIRKLLERYMYGRNMMVDFSALIAILLIGLIKLILFRGPVFF